MKQEQVFALQPTKSFPDGAPQRESYDSDVWYDHACKKYDYEWRTEYTCPGCSNFHCPGCGGKGR